MPNQIRALLLAAVALFFGTGSLQAQDGTIGLALIPEMDYIPEVDEWSACAGYPAEVTRVTAAWKGSCVWVASQLDAALVQRLSKWARPEMAKYSVIAPLSNPAFQPVSANKTQDKIVFRCTIETLPTHSPLVRRFLQLYVLWNKESGSIIRATVTIRGEVLE